MESNMFMPMEAWNAIDYVFAFCMMYGIAVGSRRLMEFLFGK